jgi:hypothetical protein
MLRIEKRFALKNFLREFLSSGFSQVAAPFKIHCNPLLLVSTALP